MKIHLYDWGERPISNGVKKPMEGDYLLKVPMLDLSVLAEYLDQLDNKPLGLVPPFDPSSLAYTARCATTVMQRFPEVETYAPVPLWCARDFLRSARAAGFQAFIFPFLDPWASVYQVIHDLVEGKKVHAAGGEVEMDGWTWSEEKL